MNQRLLHIEPSKSVTLMAKAKRLQQTDPAILNLAGGEPDFPTPQRVCDEAMRQMQAGFTHYTDGPGIPELRTAIAKKLQQENNIDLQAENVLITPGAKMAVYLTVRSLLNDEDEAMWLTPGWVSYPSIIQASGGVPIPVHLKWEDDYRINREALEAAVSEKTKLLIINYPNNPTGKILSESDRMVLKDFLLAHPNIVLLSDEIYEKIIYQNHKVVSMASIPELRDRVIVINGFSKCSAMTGWRLGYLACSKELFAVVFKLFQHTMSCTSGFLQKAAVVALDCKEETETMRQAYESRRNLLVKEFASIPTVELMAPEGAFYAWVKFDWGMDSEQICDYLLEHAKIVGVPGSAYGEIYENCVRFSFAASEEVLKKMIAALKKEAEKFVNH